MTTNNNNNNSTIMDQQEFCIPGFQLMCLTPEEDDYNYEDYNQPEEEYNWIDDCECQENLACVLKLNPEECIIDKDNHIQNMDVIQLFFEEIGILYDEPEPIDPTRDYEAEAKTLIEERNKSRKQHIELASPMPSLDDTTSGISSTFSSFHGTDEHHHNLVDIRSPLYMGCSHPGQQPKMTAYAYASHVSSIRTPI